MSTDDRDPARSRITAASRIEAATRALRAMDYQHGGGFCGDLAAAALPWGQQLVAHTAERVTGRLLLAMADLHAVAGWLDFDTGRLPSARGHLVRALELAGQGNDPVMASGVLYRMGRMCLHHNAPERALAFFERGQRTAQAVPDGGSRLASALLRINQAWAHAAMNHPVRANQLANDATDEFAQADLGRAPAWATFFDATDLSAMIGTVHTVLARQPDRNAARHTRIAIPALTIAVEAYGPEMTRSRVFCLIMLATDHLLDGDIDHAVTVGRQAVHLAERLMSSRVKDRMQPLAAEAHRRRSNADVADLARQIATFVATRPGCAWNHASHNDLGLQPSCKPWCATTG